MPLSSIPARADACESNKCQQTLAPWQGYPHWKARKWWKVVHKLHGRQQAGLLCRALATCSHHPVLATNSKRFDFLLYSVELLKATDQHIGRRNSSNNRPWKGFCMSPDTRTLDTWITRMALCMPSLYGRRHLHKHDRRWNLKSHCLRTRPSVLPCSRYLMLV